MSSKLARWDIGGPAHVRTHHIITVTISTIIQTNYRMKSFQPGLAILYD
jgi:hypothetical protein